MKTVLTEFTELCAICGGAATGGHHLLFGSYRKLADRDKLILPICDNCHMIARSVSDRIHDNSMAESLSKIAGQLAWEKEYYRKGQPDTARIEFTKRYGRSFL